METVLLVQAEGAGESNLLQRLLRNQWRSGDHGGGRDRRQPAGMRRSIRPGVDVVLHRDARCGVGGLYRGGLVMWVDGGVA